MGWSWFKFNNLGLALGENLKFSVKRVKTKSQKVLGPNSYVCRSYWGKTSTGGLFGPSVMNRVKERTTLNGALKKHSPYRNLML